MSMTASILILVSAVGSTWGEVPLSAMPQSEVHTVANSQSCPVNLSAQRQEIERLIKSVSNASFKTTILASLKASIPDAIRQADGINPQIAFLRKEIVAQDQFRKDAEEIARKSSGNFSVALLPCKPGEKGSYCSAVERFYISSASNVANRGFLAALECYKRNGAR